MKIFRKFRLDSIVTKRFTNYFSYAIGEILLVMLGILLALQVDDWNTERKSRIEEQELYSNLLTVLDKDLEHVNQKSEKLKNSIDALELFILNEGNSILKQYNIKEVDRKLGQVNGVSSSFMPNKAFYNKMNSNNQIDLIQSNALKVDIIKLYEHYYVRYNDLDLNIEEMSVFHLQNNYFSLIIDRFYIKNNLDSTTFLKHYDILNSECRKIYNLAKLTHGAMLDCKKHIEYLQVEIKKEQNMYNE